MQLGFSEKEASVYLMLLRVGPSPVSSLARRINMKRVTVYAVLNSLIQRGLVTFEEAGSCRRYIPHDPECLLYGLEKQHAELRFRMGLAKDCIEKLNGAESIASPQLQSVIFFRGLGAVKRALAERLDKRAALFVVFMNFTGDSQAANCLRNFVRHAAKTFSRLVLCVPQKFMESAVKQFPQATCKGVDFGISSVKGNLLVQKDRVFFLFSNEKDIQMMYVNDPTYAAYFLEVLLAPFISS